ncbi:MAG TPA: S41 family peptidase [Gemmataceae bacterium]|jgi:carboxyl-terminal processing protease
MYDPRIQRRNRLVSIFLILAAFYLGLQVERHGWISPWHEPADVRQTFRPFWETWYLVHDKYVDQSSVNDERMTQMAILGMLASLGDIGHTTYLTKEEVQRLQEDLKGELYGIGASLGMRKKRPTIIYTLPNSPARAAGLKPGDVIEEVNGQDVKSLSFAQILQRVRGQAGTEVHLKVQRPEPPQTVDLDIKRARVEVPDASWQMLPGVPIAHVSLRNFGERTDEQLREALEAAKKQGAKGIILDVRGNPGGIKEQAVKVTSEFLKPDEVVFLQKDAKGQTQPMLAEKGGVAPDIPLCVLIDENTASSAEILSGAIQDHERGKLIGARTVGTGTVLGHFQLTDGSAVLLAIYEWLTPKGRQIWHKGITPDIEVSLPPDASIVMPESDTKLTADKLARSDDTQLLKAIEVMKKELK